MNNILETFNSWLLTPAFEAFGTPTTWLEIIGFLTGIICVYGVVIQKIWNYYWAVLNAGSWALLFWGYGLYMDGILQLAFIALSVYGWWKWTYGGNKGKDTLPVVKTNNKQWLVLGTLTLLATALVATFSHWFQTTVFETVQTTFILDASILTFSLLATFMQARKMFESWWVWIAIDVVSIPLYIYKGLTLTALVYIIFLALCIKGLIAWRKELKQEA